MTRRPKSSLGIAIGVGVVAVVVLASSVCSSYFALDASRSVRATELELRANGQALAKLSERMAQVERRCYAARQQEAVTHAAPAAPPAAAVASVEQWAQVVAEQAATERELVRSARSDEQVEAFDAAARAFDRILRTGRWTVQDGNQFSKLTSALHPDDVDEFRRQLSVAVNAGTLTIDGDASF